MAATFGPRFFCWRRSQEARLESYFRRDREGPHLSHQGWQSSIQCFRSSEAGGLMRCRRNVAMVVPRPKRLLRTRSRISAKPSRRQNNHMIDALAPDRSDQPFGKAILPRRGWCGRLVPDAHGAKSACDNAPIDPIPIADEVVRSLIPGKGLRYLTRDPFCRRICCDVDPDEVSAAEPDDDEGIKQVETDRWNHEQVHGGDVRRVVAQEGSPSLAGWPPSFDHVLGDARLRDLKPELEQFAVDAWRAPKWIFDTHPPDQHAQFRVDLRSPSLWARLPTPVAAKAGAVPTLKRLGPDDGENLQD